MPARWKIVSVCALACLSLSVAGCSSGPASDSGGVESYDISKIKADPKLHEMLPPDKRDSWTAGAFMPYSPAEFFDDSNQPIGYEVDTLKALGKLMGVKDVQFNSEEFNSLLDRVNDGTFDLVMSTLTLKKSRMRQVNMVSFVNVGVIYAVGPNSEFDYTNPCGFKVGARTDTTMMEALKAASDTCVAEGKEPIKIAEDQDQEVLNSQAAEGTLDAVLGEEPSMLYGQIKFDGFTTVGQNSDVAPQGPVFAKNDEAFAKAVQAGLQEMMDTGLLVDVLKPWGVESLALNYATLNPPLM